VISAGFEAFASQAAFADFFLFEQIQGDAVQSRKILRGVALTHTAVVLGKAHVQRPMQLIFYLPMVADQLAEVAGVAAAIPMVQAGDVVTPLTADLAG